MKRILVLAIALIVVSASAYAGWSSSWTVTDDNGNFLGLAPKALVTIQADEAIDDADGNYYRAIRPTADITIYYDGTPGTTDTVDADTAILVHPDMRISANTLCYVF